MRAREAVLQHSAAAFPVRESQLLLLLLARLYRGGTLGGQAPGHRCFVRPALLCSPVCQCFGLGQEIIPCTRSVSPQSIPRQRCGCGLRVMSCSVSLLCVRLVDLLEPKSTLLCRKAAQDDGDKSYLI